jgi:hypothetical protein
MDTYRFNVLDRSGQVTGSVDIAECENDDAAIHHARKYADGNAVEVWQGDRRVGLIEPGE